MSRLIRASEIGEYVYCHRAWWLHVVEGLTPGRPERLARGATLHARHGLRVSLSWWLMLVGLGALALSLVWGLLG